jgi:predicted flap endonuclease-1-like 5' DNA nuclease
LFKQIFKFSLGVGLGVLIFYGLRRFLTGSNLPPQPELPAVKPPEPVEPARPSAKFTVRTSGPRPQAPANGSGDSTLSAADGSAPAPASKSEIAEAPAVVETSEAPELTPEVEIPRRMMTADTEVTQEASGTGEMVESMTGAADTETAPEVTKASGTNDDFEIINDIGPTFTSRLHEAGVKSFQELADMSVEQIAEIARVPASRVVNNRWREQSARLAQGLPLEESDKPS